MHNKSLSSFYSLQATFILYLILLLMMHYDTLKVAQLWPLDTYELGTHQKCRGKQPDSRDFRRCISLSLYLSEIWKKTDGKMKERRRARPPIFVRTNQEHRYNRHHAAAAAFTAARYQPVAALPLPSRCRGGPSSSAHLSEQIAFTPSPLSLALSLVTRSGPPYAHRQRSVTPARWRPVLLTIRRLLRHGVPESVVQNKMVHYAI